MRVVPSAGRDEARLRPKAEIRGTLRAARAARRVSAGIVTDAADPGVGLADVALPRLAGLGVVALFASRAGEPDTTTLRAGLRDAGVAVLLPWLRDDLDLDWVHDRDSPSTLRPPGPRLGVTAITTAHAVVVPALAVDTAGRRLGQGGGSYDRVITRVIADAIDEAIDGGGSVDQARPLLVGCVFDSEVFDGSHPHWPEEAHDRRVDVILTPTRWLDLTS